MEEYRIDLKVRNNLILRKVESIGYKSIHQFCIDCKLSYGSLLKFTNMNKSIFDIEGKIKPFIHKLCNKLKCLPEEIFSATQMETELKSNKRTFQVREAEMIFLMNQSDNQKLLENFIEEDQLSLFTDRALRCLSPRQKKIIQMRFGLGEYNKEYTLQEIADQEGVHRQRIRQIESVALRMLRHSSVSDNFRVFIDPN